GYLAKRKTVTSPTSTLRESILKILKDEGYIASYSKLRKDNAEEECFNINLKYHYGFPAISEISSVSKPGKRVYCGFNEIPSIKNGLSLIILSTSSGVLSGHQAKILKVGGEVLLKVF